MIQDDPVQRLLSSSSRISAMTDVCGRGAEFQTESSKPASILETHEGYLKSRAPSFSNYATLDARLGSYETWPN